MVTIFSFDHMTGENREFEKSMSVLSISLGHQLKRRERRESVVLKNRFKMFRDNNHQSLYKKIKLYNDIECRESGTSIRE